MNGFWITALLTISFLTGVRGGEFTVSKDTSRQTIVKDKDPDGKEVPARQPQINNLKSNLDENNLTLTWTLTGYNDIVSFSVEKINEYETKHMGEIKVQGAIEFEYDYSFTDIISKEELEQKTIIYRIQGLDSSGRLVTQKQILVEIDNEFEGYDLFPNYPNPFNPVTTIKYQIPVQDHVTVKVFNILGNLISILVDETKPAGTYQLEFYGTGLTSGVYLYTIQAGEYTETKRMILMK